MKLTQEKLRSLIAEELSKADKAEIKKMINKETDKARREFEKQLKKDVEREVEKLLKAKATKDEIAEISKKVLKKLYRDMAIQHPYIIDRIKI
jgi:uncharacterized membrane-anchored protein YjiN (DUF445 family)